MTRHEQLAFSFPNKTESQTSVIFSDQRVEPLSRQDRQTLLQAHKSLLICKEKVRTKQKEVSIARYRLVLASTKGSIFFDGSSFAEKYEKPLERLVEQLDMLEKQVATLLDPEQLHPQSTRVEFLLAVVQLIKDSNSFLEGAEV